MISTVAIPKALAVFLFMRSRVGFPLTVVDKNSRRILAKIPSIFLKVNIIYIIYQFSSQLFPPISSF